MLSWLEHNISSLFMHQCPEWWNLKMLSIFGIWIPKSLLIEVNHAMQPTSWVSSICVLALFLGQGSLLVCTSHYFVSPAGPTISTTSKSKLSKAFLWLLAYNKMNNLLASVKPIFWSEQELRCLSLYALMSISTTLGLLPKISTAYPNLRSSHARSFYPSMQKARQMAVITNGGASISENLKGAKHWVLREEMGTRERPQGWPYEVSSSWTGAGMANTRGLLV